MNLLVLTITFSCSDKLHTFTWVYFSTLTRHIQTKIVIGIQSGNVFKYFAGSFVTNLVRVSNGMSDKDINLGPGG